ncbi:MAG: endonuclease MutS2 [Clostridiales bacterium]|jgi:DNA mismatch repair protein MutS2|nr:endonuclease MutS2 [Clostridiales bacterium]
MDDKTLKTLEFDKIASMLSAKAVSAMAKEMASGMRPMTNLRDITEAQNETSEAAAMILKKDAPPLGGLKNIAPSLRRASAGGALSIEEALYIGDFSRVCRKVKQYAKEVIGDTDGYETLSPLFFAVSPTTALEKEIDRCIVSDSEIADDASAALRDVRRAIRAANDKIKEQLNVIIRSQAYKNMIQDNVITIRNGRYCIPVKSERRDSFPGLTHDQSATGATVFIEPMSVVKLNNELKELAARESAEITKVLRKISEEVALNFDVLSSNLELLTALDFSFAKGALSVDMRASRPRFNENGFINIKKGRHPLLDGDSVVPTDIYVGGGFTTLLITGPNTGGKTVSLKTLGLFSIMGQAGLHIPAFDDSELSVFDRIFADIGDEQSIEQNLSTFSSHISNIVNILQCLTPNSLALLDELGAGTDPTEGAAIAVAILRYLRERKVIAAVTTHYSELKLYALSADGVENAACEFDVATLRPTYKLLIGVPGKSNAFAIARRLGLPESIIDMAKETLSREDAKFEDILADMEIDRKALETEREKAESYRLETERIKAELDRRESALAARRDKILLEAKEEAERITRIAAQEADALMKQYQKAMREDELKLMELARGALREKSALMSEDLGKARTPCRAVINPPKSLKKGDRVFIHSLARGGIVVSPPDEGGEALITVGIMKMKAKLSDMSLDDSEENVSVNAASLSRGLKAVKSSNISPETDLRGLTVSEALEKAGKYIDDAWMSSLSRVTIIHGKGTGALRKAISSMLKGHSQVKSFRPGEYGEGESGVTVVELEK